MPESVPPRASVVIAAHNEGAGLFGTLHALLSGAGMGEFEVVVAANGCTDDTAAVARSCSGVRVLELPVADKAQAINAADQTVAAFPRIYLDADIRLASADVRKLCAALEQCGGDAPDARLEVLAVSPRRRVVTRGRPLVVRAYFAVNARLPAFDDALFGRGVIVVSERGRRRFERFPAVIADDLYLDSLFAGHEKRVVSEVEVVVAAPPTARELLSRLERVRRGNLQLRASHTGQGNVRASRRWSWLFDVVLPHPWLSPAAICYVAFTVMAERRARRAGSSTGWGGRRGGSTRMVSVPPSRPVVDVGDGPGSQESAR